MEKDRETPVKDEKDQIGGISHADISQVVQP